MFLAEVIGKMWATRKSPGLNGKRMLIVEKIRGNPPELSGERLMAVTETIDAGTGDIVLVMDEGGSARAILNDATAPVRTIIVGILDSVLIHDSYFSSQAISASLRKMEGKRRTR